MSEQKIVKLVLPGSDGNKAILDITPLEQADAQLKTRVDGIDKRLDDLESGDRQFALKDYAVPDNQGEMTAGVYYYVGYKKDGSFCQPQDPEVHHFDVYLKDSGGSVKKVFTQYTQANLQDVAYVTLGNTFQKKNTFAEGVEVSLNKVDGSPNITSIIPDSTIATGVAATSEATPATKATLVGTEVLEEKLSEIKRITAGKMSITINGKLVNVTDANFSEATSMNDVATKLQEKIPDTTVAYNNKFTISTNATGKSATITVASAGEDNDIATILGLTNGTPTNGTDLIPAVYPTKVANLSAVSSEEEQKAFAGITVGLSSVGSREAKLFANGTDGSEKGAISVSYNHVTDKIQAVAPIAELTENDNQIATLKNVKGVNQSLVELQKKVDDHLEHAIDRIPHATTEEFGIVELATKEEVLAGTKDKVVEAEGLKALTDEIDKKISNKVQIVDNVDNATTAGVLYLVTEVSSEP